MKRQSRQGQALRALPLVAALTASPPHADLQVAKAIGRQPNAHASGGAFALGLTGIQQPERIGTVVLAKSTRYVEEANFNGAKLYAEGMYA